MVSGESLDRRSFIKKSAAGAAGAAFLTHGETGKSVISDGKPEYPLRFSACCSSFGDARQTVEAVKSAYKSGLDGVSMRFVYDLSNPGALRHRNVQISFRDACLQYGIQINSLMVGGLIRANPNSVVWVMDSIKCARNLGANVILLALLRNGFPSTDEEYGRTIAVFKELGPKAADEGVILGLECSGSAQEQLRIIEGVDHPSVRIYYDYFNAMHFGYDPLVEIPVLADTICEYHVKNGPRLLRENLKGARRSDTGGTYPELDHVAIANTIKKTGYKGWLTFETSSPSGDRIADMKDNLEYSRKIFS